MFDWLFKLWRTEPVVESPDWNDGAMAERVRTSSDYANVKTAYFHRVEAEARVKRVLEEKGLI